jgi:hypothetical protein
MIDSIGTSSTSATATAHRPHQMPADVKQAVADKLGMSADDLQAELSSGKHLNEIAKEKGVDMKDIHATIRQTLQKDGITGPGGAEGGHRAHHHHHAADVDASASSPAPASSADPSVGQQVDVLV